MADGVAWFFELVDKVSAPAKTMADGVGKVGEALAKTDAAMAKSASAAEKLAAKQKKAREEAGGFQLDVGHALSEWSEGIPSMLATAAAGIVAAGASLVAAGVAFAAHATDSKRNALFALQTFLGAGQDARATMEELEGYAGRSALAKDAFLGFGNRLLGAGFQKQELAPLLAAVSDVVGATGGNAAAGEKLVMLLEKARTQNKLDPRELMQLGNIGISNDSIAQAIASQRKITIDEAYAVLNSGQMNGNQISDALLGAVAGKGKSGVLGDIGEEFAGGSLTVGIQHLQDAFGDLFENVKEGGLIDFIHMLTDSLKGEGGAKFIEFVNQAFADMSAWLATISMDDLTSGISAVIDVLSGCWTVVKGVWAAVSGFGEGFMTVIDGVMPVVSDLWKLMGGGASDSTSGMEILKTVFEVLGWVIGGVVMAVVLLAEGIMYLVAALTTGLIIGVQWVIEMFGKLVDEIAGIPANFMRLGGAIVDGLWDGLKAGWAALVSNFTGLVDLLPQVVKKALGIASPSTVFMGFGFNVAEGFGEGIDRGDMPGRMQDAMALPTSPAAGLPGGAGGASSLVNHSPSVTFNIEVKGDAHDAEGLAAELGRVLLPQLTHAFEQLAMEVGG